MTDNLSLTQLSESQNNKEVTINSTNGELDAAITAVLTVEVNNTNAATVIQAQLQRASAVVIVEGTPAPTGPISLTYDAFSRGMFALINTTGQTVSSSISGQPAGAPTVPTNEAATLHMDGTNVRKVGGEGAGGGGVTTFTALSDTPGSYAGEANKAVVVNGLESALVFGNVATVFTALGDTPSSYVGEAGQLLAVNGLESGVEFVAGSGGVTTFTGLTDTPGSFVGEGGRFMRVNLAENAIEFIDAPGSTFVSLSDTPVNYTGAAGQAAIVNGTEDGMIFAAVASAFLGLSDTPATYAGQAGLFPRVNVAENALEFVAVAGGITTFLGLTDTPGTFVGEGGKSVVVNNLEDALEFVDRITSFTDLDDTPANFTGQAGNVARVNAGATALEFYDPSVVELNAQAMSYTLVLADRGKIVRMNVASANDLTVPPNSSVAFAIGTIVTVRQAGTGQTTIVEGSGVTINTPETLLCRGQHATVSLVKVGTDEWDITGDLEAAP